MRGPEPRRVEIVQVRQTGGHYECVPVEIENVLPGTVRYKDVTVTGPLGWEWLSGRLPAHNLRTGDKIVTLKAILPDMPIVVVARPAPGVLELSGPQAILEQRANDGALDPGFFLAFGSHGSADDLDGSGDPVNPAPEPTELRILALGDFLVRDPIRAVRRVVVEDMSDVAVNVGDVATVVIRSLNTPKTVVRGHVHDFGSAIQTAGALPHGTVIRIGYQNLGTESVSAYGELDVSY